MIGVLAVVFRPSSRTVENCTDLALMVRPVDNSLDSTAGKKVATDVACGSVKRNHFI